MKLLPVEPNHLHPNKAVERVQELGAFLDRSAREQRGSAINAVALGRVGQCQHQRRGTQLEVHLADLQHLQVEPLDEHIGRNSWLSPVCPIATVGITVGISEKCPNWR